VKATYSDGVRMGMLDTLGLFLPVLAFGIGFGAAASAAGLPSWLATAMSGGMFAGASQFAVLDLWKKPMPLLSMCVVVIAVNARHIVLGASLRQRLAGLPASTLYLSAILLSDANWALTQSRQVSGSACCGHLVGGGVVLWLAWTCGSMLGAIGGSLFGDLRVYGLDVIMPAFFVTMLFSMASAPRRDLPPWALAAAVAGGLCLVIPTHYAALAGTAAGGLFSWFTFDRVR